MSGSMRDNPPKWRNETGVWWPVVKTSTTSGERYREISRSMVSANKPPSERRPASSGGGRQRG